MTCTSYTDDVYGLTIYMLTMWFKDLYLLSGIGSNGFIGDRRNYVRMVVT